MLLDLFEQLTAPVVESAERRFLIDIGSSCLLGRPTEPIWGWAGHEVWIGAKMAAQPKLYDITRTPWTKEWQELPMNDRGIREAYVMKDSRSGFTEASLNILRWMPGHWPGGALYSINSKEKAREVCDKRMMGSLEKVAGAFFTADPNDANLSKISLENMEILFAGSGASGPFMEAWFRLIILDELENHIQNQETTTLQRAKSRQTDVPDGLLLGMSKPEHAGGIIDLAYVSGSQKKYMVPCPRCERRIEMSRKLLVYGHCEEKDGWNLERVRRETHYQCLFCSGTFLEREKFAMVNEGIWVPTPLSQRRTPPSGKYVPPDPAIESYHMSSYYSLHERSTCGDLAVEILKAEVVSPTPEGKKYVMVNFDGWPFEESMIAVSADAVKALIAGHIVETKSKGPDGVETVTRTALAPDVLTRDHEGKPRDPSFKLAFQTGAFAARLPFKPALLTSFTDKQFTHLKTLVFALLWDGTPFLVDIIYNRNEEEWEKNFQREYFIEGQDASMTITRGLFDCGHRPQEVYRACFSIYNKSKGRVQIYPCKGEGERQSDEDSTSKDATARRMVRHVVDWCDGKKIVVRIFNDHSVKSEFYHTRIQERSGNRPWLPSDVPKFLINEWTAERYDEVTRAWIHNKNKYGPNDFGDCGKFLYVWLAEFLQQLIKDFTPRPAKPVEEPPPEDPPEAVYEDFDTR